MKTFERIIQCYRRKELRPAALQTIIEDLAEQHEQTQQTRLIMESIDPGNPQAAEVRTQLLIMEGAWLELQRIVELRLTMVRVQQQRNQKGAA